MKDYAIDQPLVNALQNVTCFTSDVFSFGIFEYDILALVLWMLAVASGKKIFIPYEKSFWGALEDPLRCLIAFIAFSQIVVTVAPTTILSQYTKPVWKDACIFTFLWFLRQWKKNVINRALVIKPIEDIDRDKLLVLDKISSVGLYALGGMALAEACGVAMQSVLTVGAIGGLAARDILGSVLCGLSVQFSRSFSLGDIIQVGSVEGEVIEMRLTTTSLRSAQNFLIVVPNMRFYSQVIVNKSRAAGRAMLSEISLQIDDFDKIPLISEEINEIMRSNSNVCLRKEQPYCYLSKAEKSFFVLSIGCTLEKKIYNTTSLHLRGTFPQRLYSSSTASDGKDVHASSSSGSEASGFDGNGFLHMVKETLHSTVNAASQIGEKAKKALVEVTAYVVQLLATYPYLQDAIFSVLKIIMPALVLYAILTRVFRTFHRYSVQGPRALLPLESLWPPVSYENSFWGSLDYPLKCLIFFIAFTQIVVTVVPTTILSQYTIPAWKDACIFTFLWFLRRWKKNVINRALVIAPIEGIDRDKLLVLDKISSVGLYALGGMALAEACGVAIQSVLTVGAIGGLAARDILGSVLCGLSVQLSRSFSLGDTIQVGSVEGEVIEMGLTTTSLRSAQNFLIVVPNLRFSSQVIVNKSRAAGRAMLSEISLQIDDFDKIALISEEINEIMRSNSNVCLRKEQPYCYLSKAEKSFFVLSIGCTLEKKSIEELLSTEHDILMQSIQIIKNHGVNLASTQLT